MRAYISDFFSDACLTLRDKYNELEKCNAQQIGWLGILAIVGFYCLVLLIFPSEPPDDLLRHLKAYTYGYDYRLMFPFSPGIPAFDHYLFFDMAVGAVHRIVGHDACYLVQVAALILNAVGIYLLCKDAPSANWRFTLTMLAVAFILQRITLGRPSIFESGLFLLGLAACRRENVAWWWHLALSLLMASFYYLFFIYLIPLVIHRRVYLVGLAAGFIGWFCYAGTGYFHLLEDIFHVGMTYGAVPGHVFMNEQAPLIPNFHMFLLFLVPVACFWRKDVKRLVSVAWFALADQVRYLETIIPVLASYAQYWPIRLSQVNLFVILVTTIFYANHRTDQDNSWKVLSGIVPAGSTVLCLENETVFKLIYANDKIRVTPGLDLHWESPEYRACMAEVIDHGALPSGILSGHKYDYVVEKNLKVVPTGLSLYRISGKYRVWKVPSSIKGDNA